MLEDGAQHNSAGVRVQLSVQTELKTRKEVTMTQIPISPLTAVSREEDEQDDGVDTATTVVWISSC